MPAPHPVQLRQRVVDAYEEGQGSFRVIAERFKVGEASVNRWVALKRKQGSVEARPMGGSRGRRLVGDEGEAFVTHILQEVADTTLVELCSAYLDKFDIVVSPQRMSVVVRRAGFTRKRGSFVR